MIRVAHHTNGPRVYVIGLRLHHGVSGAALAAVALAAHRRGLALGFAIWAATDYRDFPFTDHNNH